MWELTAAVTLAALGVAQEPSAPPPDPPVANQLWRIDHNPTIAEVVARCGGDVQHDQLGKLSPSTRRATVKCYLRQMSEQLNRRLPTRSDYTTLLELTTVSGLTITYRFRADVYLKEIRAGAMDAWKPSVRAEICADPVMHEIISLGGAYRYIWRDRGGRYIGSLLVSGCALK